MIKLLLFAFLFSLYPIYAENANDKPDCSAEFGEHCKVCDESKCIECNDQAYFFQNKDCVPCEESPCEICNGSVFCSTCPTGFVGPNGIEAGLCDFCK